MIIRFLGHLLSHTYGFDVLTMICVSYFIRRSSYRVGLLANIGPRATTFSGVARVLCALAQEIFLRPRQQKLLCLKWNIGAKVRKKQSRVSIVVLYLFFLG